jgi:shikimate dehydrogenase
MKNESPKIVGLIGYPLGHSISPQMHNTAFKFLGLNYEYLPFEVHPNDLIKALEGFRATQIAGFNVTIPFKEKVVEYLDEITKLARLIGAVNTVENQDGKFIGYNTDGPGFIESLNEDANFDPKGKKAVVLGAGGAGKAVSLMLAHEGTKEVTITDIDENKAKDLSLYLNAHFGTKTLGVHPHSQELQAKIKEANLLVNATPIGMHPNTDASPLDKNIELHPKLLVYDLVYNPARTKLMEEAEKAGAKTVSGLGMLIQQGALAFSIFTMKEAPIKVMWQAAKEALKG